VTLDGEYPLSFMWRGEVHVVGDVTDRWRIDGEWWRGGVRREYFKLLTEDGWLVVDYHDKAAGVWHLQRGYD
jgi:hypothetical protein